MDCVGNYLGNEGAYTVPFYAPRRGCPMKNLLVRLGPKAPRYYVQIMAFILIVTI